MNPTPLPLCTLRLTVFNDIAPVDATYEVDAEPGLAGFTAHLSDVFGTVSVDYYANALCTRYLRVNSSGARVSVAVDSPLPIAFDANNHPVVDPASTGRCVSTAAGLVVIPNLGPDRYAATVTPPVAVAGQKYQWVQTTTLEGGHDHDIWEHEGSTGYDTEQTKGAELGPAVQFGFVKTQALRVPVNNPPNPLGSGASCGDAITGVTEKPDEELAQPGFVLDDKIRAATVDAPGSRNPTEPRSPGSTRLTVRHRSGCAGRVEVAASSGSR